MKLPLLVAATLVATLGAPLGMVALGRVPDAGAECASPEVGFLPAPGATVPPGATIYVFVPRLHRKGRVVVEGAGASAETVARSDAYDVVRVVVRAHDPGQELVVRWRDEENPDREASPSAHYQIGKTPPNRARVIGVSRHEERWTCSFADAIRLELEGTAIAYRLAWHDGSTTTLPADDRVMWPHHMGSPAAPVTAAELGHLDCMGDSVSSRALATAREFDLYALFADGSEIRIGRSVAQLGDRGVRLPIELLEGGHDARPSLRTPRVTEARPPWQAAAFGALGGAIVVLGAALRGRRRRRDHTPRH